MTLSEDVHRTDTVQLHRISFIAGRKPTRFAPWRLSFLFSQTPLYLHRWLLRKIRIPFSPEVESCPYSI